MTPRGVLAFCREKEVKAIDLRFTDLFGTWQHVTIPVSRLSEASFEHGFAIDTSTHAGSTSLDRLVIPQASTAFLDPFSSIPTLILIGNLQDPITRDEDLFDARMIAERSISFLQGTGIADQARFASTCEFYLFNDVQIALAQYRSSVCLDSDVTRSSVHREESNGPLGSSDSNIVARSISSVDSSFDLRNSIMDLLMDAGLPVFQHFQIDRRGSQAAIEIGARELVAAADAVMTTKYFVRSNAARHERIATFMPKPIEGSRGSGLPLQFSLWRGEEPLFGGQAYGGLSDIAMLSIGGILHHAGALTAICNPSTNSYRRLHYSVEPPFLTGYSQQSRQSTCGIPSSSGDPRAKCIEIRTPDASVNPYLAFAAILMAAIDGIQNKIEPGQPISFDSDPPSSMPRLPRSLWDALDCLEQDSNFLTRGDVFSQEMLGQWLSHKRDVERKAVESFSTPAEYERYFDC